MCRWPLTCSFLLSSYLTKKQVDEGILELNFLEKKSSFGLAQIPLRTLCSKHYHEKEKDEKASKIKPRIVTINKTTNTSEWQGFRAQLIKNDLVRGTIYVNSECTSVGIITDMLSAYKTYFIGIDNLMHLTKHNAGKLVQYITPDVLNTLKLATICHRTRRSDAVSSSSSNPTLRRRNRASLAVSAVDVQALAQLEKAFMEAEPDPEDRYLLLGLWRALFSCPDVAVKLRLVQCGLFKIISAMLTYTEDPELIIHFVEGIKYLFVLPDTVKAITKKKKAGSNILNRLVEIASSPVSSPAQGQVVMRVMDIFYYFDDPSSANAMVDAGLVTALTKLAVDGSAFLALRSKALELFRIIPTASRKAIFASGILGNFSELLASPSNRSTHHSFLSRVLSFLNFLATEDVSNIASDKILQNLVMLLSFKQATEQNKIEALKIITLAMSKYSQPILDANLPFALASQLLDPNTRALREPILAFFSQPLFEDAATFPRLLDGGVFRLMFELFASTTNPAETVVAHKFLAHPSLKKEHLVDAGLVSAVETLVDYTSLACRSVTADADLESHAKELVDLALSVGPAPDFQKSKIPSSLADLLRYAPIGLVTLNQFRTIDPKLKLFPSNGPAAPVSLRQSGKLCNDHSMLDDSVGLQLPPEVAERYLKLLPIVDDETFFKLNIHELLLTVAFSPLSQSLSDTCWKLLEARKGWLEKVDKEILFPTIQTFGTASLTNAKKSAGLLQDLEPGSGVAAFVLDCIKNFAPTATLFELITSKLANFESYLEIINDPNFLDVMLVSARDVKAPVLYDIVKAEMKKSTGLLARLREPTVVFALLANLMSAVEVLCDKPSGVVNNSAIAVRDFAYEFLSTSPSLEEVIGSRGVSYLLQLIAEPATGLKLLMWALGFLDKALPKITEAEIADIGVQLTLWNVVDTCDLTKESSAGSLTSFPTQVSLEAWKILCKLPNYLSWLNALPGFTKTVTTWFFSAQSNFQMMALSIMEPTRWARAGCSTAEQFAAWRLKLNRGRLAYCSSQKDMNLLEVSKLARSFANNRVIEDDLQWISNKSDMDAALLDFQAIDVQLRPADQGEQTKEYATLLDYVKFLRVCKNEQVKQRFIPLLDTFHDSLFFLPDKTPSDADWVKYYACDVDKAAKSANETRLKQSLARSATSTLASKAESKKLTSGLSSSVSKTPVPPPAPGKWRPNTPPQYQLMRIWQFKALAQQVRFFGALTPLNNHVFELCWDSIQQGFDIRAMRQRTTGMDRILIVAHVTLPKTGLLSTSNAQVGFFVPGQLRFSGLPSPTTIPSKVIALSFQNADDLTRVTKLDVASDPINSGYSISTTADVIKLSQNVGVHDDSITINFANRLLSFNSVQPWCKDIWNPNGPTKQLTITHMQAFRVANSKSVSQLTVMTRRGYNSNSSADDDDSIAAAEMEITDLAGLLDDDVDNKLKKVTFAEEKKVEKKVEKKDTTSATSDETDLSGMDAESFMNRYLAKALNRALEKQLDEVRSARPILTSQAPPGGPKPTWIRAFRHSFRDSSALGAQVNMFTQLTKAGGENKPIFGIIKMKWTSSFNGDSTKYTAANAPIFGFYLHNGLSETKVGAFQRDNFAMLFSLRGPNSRAPAFFPINIEESAHAYRLVNEAVIQFGLGTDLMLNFSDPMTSFSNLGCTYRLPDDISFMTKEAQSLLTEDRPMSWEFEEVELYYKTTAKTSLSMPTPTLGHLLRLLGQKDVLLLNQIRWRLKYLMVSASTENKRQILEEIRRAQTADMQAQVLEPENNLTKRIEHPGVEKISLRPVAVNGRELSKSEIDELQTVIFHPTSPSFVGDAAVMPFDITFAILPSTVSETENLTNEEIAAIPIEQLPYLTHVILAARAEGSKVAQRAKAAVIFASDSQLPSQVLSAAFPETRTYVDDYAKVIAVNAKDHLRWYEHHAPSALDPSRNFHIGPLLRPAEAKLAKDDTGMVSNSEDNFWSFLRPLEDDYKVEAKTLEVPSHQTFVEDYQLDRLRVDTDPVGLIELKDTEEVGAATLSAAVRSRYITIRFLPNSSNKPVYFSTLKFLGYHPENNHFLVPPKPEAIVDVLPVYTSNMVTPATNHFIGYDSDEADGIIKKLRDEVHKGDAASFSSEFMLRFSNHLFDQSNMKSEQFYMGRRPSPFFWGGNAPTWFMWRFLNMSVCPTAFMLRHGYNKNNSFIQNFVFQGTNDVPGPGMVWTDIENFPNHYHSFSGEGYVFKLKNPPTQFFSAFRIFQRGDYYMGPGVKGSAFMCVSEFEIFGEMQYNEGAEPQKIVTKAFTNADVDAALGFNDTYDAPMSKLLPHA